ncbi:MAG: iron ABC transporter permease [Geminicoccaceae bacterium]|nr:MAG: iron ABC transporter permease [Geminicoccaceae bacterium]
MAEAIVGRSAPGAGEGRSWLARIVRGDVDRALLLALVPLYVGTSCVLPLARLGLELVFAGESGLVGEVLAARSTQRALRNTLEAATLSALLAVFSGATFAFLTGLFDLRGRRLATLLFLLPILVPAQIAAIAWLQLASPASPVSGLLGLTPEPGAENPLYSREGVILLLALEHATMPFLTVRAGLAAISAEQVEAARNAGARPARVLVRIVLPLLRPALWAGGALAFVAALGNFGISALLGIPGRYTLLTSLIYQRLSGFGPRVLPEVGVLAGLLALLAVVGLLLQAALGRGVAGEAGRRQLDHPPIPLGRARWLLEPLAWGVLLLVTVMPLLALRASALVPAVGVPLTLETLTFRHFELLAAAHGAVPRAFTNSLLLAALAALLCAAASLPLAWLVHAARSRVARALDLLADAPWALSGIVLAIAVILVFSTPLPVLGVSLYGTLAILIVAYAGRFLALALRPIAAGVQQIEPALDEAAANLGARPIRRLSSVHLPLLLPSVAAGALLVFMTALNELTVSALLWSTGNGRLGVVVFMLYDEGNTGGAAAVGTVAVAVVLLLAAGASALARILGLPRGVLPWQS